MSKETIYSLLFKDNKLPLHQLLDELLVASSDSDSIESYQQLLNKYNISLSKKEEEYISELNSDIFSYKLIYMQKSFRLYSELYEFVKKNGFSIKDTLAIYSDNTLRSLPALYTNILQVYKALDEQAKAQFRAEIDNYCNVVSGRFQPFTSEVIDETDEENIRCFKRTIDILQNKVRRALSNVKVKGMYPDLIESDHLLFEIRKILESEIKEGNASKKYREYLRNIVINDSIRLEKSLKVEYLKENLEELDLILKFIEIGFKSYKKLDNTEDINFNQMIELIYFACKNGLLKEISQEDINRLMYIPYPVINKLELAYKEKYNADIYQDLKDANLNDPKEQSKYLMRVMQLGYSEALFHHIASKFYPNSPSIYNLQLISKKDNKGIDLDLYNDLVFAKNLKYLLETNNTIILNWLVKKYLKWKEEDINKLEENLNDLYQDENKINSTAFSEVQSDFIVPDEAILRLPRLYSLEDIKVNKVDNKLRLGIVLKNQNGTMIRKDKDNANYYLLHIDINDITQDKTKFEIQLNLLVGPEISNRIQILRMDNYIKKGTHKNTGAVKIDTTTHLHKYNGLNKVRKNKHGEMDIYKNWENGVEDFVEGLELFLKETGVNVELQKILKKEILKQINKHKNNRV